MSPFRRSAVASLLAATAFSLPLVASSAAWAGPASARGSVPNEPAKFDVGARLIATRDVKLRSATLQKGSRVTLVQLKRAKGRPVAADLELPDGHVLRNVAYRIVVTSFRLARD
jgi:hypothetical protein